MSIEDVEFRHSQVPLGGASIHVVETGDPIEAPFLFLHGWPESSRAWRSLMALAAADIRAIAIDLPGIGRSTGDQTDGSKADLAMLVRELVEKLRLNDLTLVGQDVGGMVTYAYLRRFDDLSRAVVMDTVVPGLGPWDQVLRNPYIWHFALHSIPALPETLVQGRQREYFGYFYDVLSPNSARITPSARSEYAEAYQTDGALTAGFNWYRTLSLDAEANQRPSAQTPSEIPLLYLRGEREGGNMNDYLDGFRDAGLSNVASGIVPGAGHFTAEEATEETWQLIRSFAGL